MGLTNASVRQDGKVRSAVLESVPHANMEYAQLLSSAIASTVMSALTVLRLLAILIVYMVLLLLQILAAVTQDGQVKSVMYHTARKVVATDTVLIHKFVNAIQATLQAAT